MYVRVVKQKNDRKSRLDRTIKLPVIGTLKTKMMCSILENTFFPVNDKNRITDDYKLLINFFMYFHTLRTVST